MNKIFISYSHKNIDVVSSLVNMIASPNIDIWIDEKSIAPGQRYATAIFEAIKNSNVYVIFLSKDALDSPWVMTELDFAINEQISRKDFRIMPVLLETCDIPAVLSNVDYIDGRCPVYQIAEIFNRELKIEKEASKETKLSGVTFQISRVTGIEIGPLCNDTTKEDLEKDTANILTELRKKAQGILINFVSMQEFDLFSEVPRFKNGLVHESVATVSGAFDGGIRNKVSISITAFNPSIKRLTRLLNERLEVLGLSSVTILLSNSEFTGSNAKEFAVRCFERLQDEYTILSYDLDNGAKIEYSDDVYLYIKCTDDALSVKFETKYDWQFENKYKEFSFDDFVKWLIK